MADKRKEAEAISNLIRKTPINTSIPKPFLYPAHLFHIPMTSPSPTIEKLSAGRTVCTVTFEEKDRIEAENTAAKKLGNAVKLDGFRPGSAPADLLKEKIDGDRLFEETIHILLSTALPSLIKEHEVSPIIPPKIEALTRTPLSVKITFVEHPEVQIKSKSVKAIDKKGPKVDTKDIDNMVTEILKQHRKTKSVDRAAEEGDQITMDFSGSDKEGKDIEGIKAEGHQVIIGSKTLIPGFEKELIGMKKNEEKSFTITFPDKYHAEHLQGTPVTFTVILKNIEEVSTPELTDDFAKEKLQASSAAEVRSRIEESMRMQEERIENQKREEKLFDSIRDATKVELAPELVEEEEKQLLDDFAQQLASKQMTMQQWMEQTGKKPEELQKEINERAQGRLKLRFGMQKLIEEKEIDVSDDEMKKAIGEMTASLTPEQRIKAAPAYAKGKPAYEQLKWQKKVERFIAETLG
jgi:trigger factor